MSIEWTPARKILPKEQGNRGIVSTSKNPSGILEYESCIERDFLLLAIHDPAVTGIQHQPKTILFSDSKGEQHKYTPDIYLEFQDGIRLLVEIKPLEEVQNHIGKFEERWNAARNWADSRGMRFIVVTDEEIRTPRWTNIWFTLGSSKCNDNARFMKKLNQIVSLEGEEYNSLCIKASYEFSVDIGKAAQIICYAIYHGFVLFDSFSTQPLSKTSIIRKLEKNRTTTIKPLWTDFLDNGSSFDEVQKESSDKGDINFSSLEIGEEDEFFQKRREMVGEWINQPLNRRTVAWKGHFFSKWGLQKSQVYRIAKRYQNEGDKGLLTRHGNAGRTKKYEGKLKDLVEEARSHYLKQNGTLRLAYTILEDLCKEESMPIPTFHAFRAYVYNNTTSAEKAQKIGPNVLKSHFTPSLSSFQDGIMPLQVIQMDNTMLDLFPVDESMRESLSTPYLTAAIDCYTGLITGFSVSFFPNSSQSILNVLVQSILPKDEYCKEYETQHEWPIQGFPVLVLVDNGMDYRSKDLKDFCLKYNIILEFVPLRTPRYKGYIEQWFNVLKNAIQREAVPGFRPSWKHRRENPDLDPEKNAAFTLIEIETWLHKWIIDDHQFSNSYEDHVQAPFLRLQNATKGETRLVFPKPREPPTVKWEIDALYLSQLEQMMRMLTKDGIQWQYLRYHSKELSEIHKIQGDHRISVRQNKRDIRFIWVQHPAKNIFIRVGLGTGWGAALLEIHGDRPIHESAWKKYVKIVRSESKEQLDPYMLKSIISKKQRKDLIESSKKTTKTARKEGAKEKESIRKDVGNKIVPLEHGKLIEDLEESIVDTRPKKKIDLSNVQLLPTDRFHGDR